MDIRKIEGRKIVKYEFNGLLSRSYDPETHVIKQYTFRITDEKDIEYWLHLTPEEVDKIAKAKV